MCQTNSLAEKSNSLAGPAEQGSEAYRFASVLRIPRPRRRVSALTSVKSNASAGGDQNTIGWILVEGQLTRDQRDLLRDRSFPRAGRCSRQPIREIALQLNPAFGIQGQFKPRESAFSTAKGRSSYSDQANSKRSMDLRAAASCSATVSASGPVFPFNSSTIGKLVCDADWRVLMAADQSMVPS